MYYDDLKEITSKLSSIKETLWRSKQWDEEITKDKLQDILDDIEDMRNTADFICSEMRPDMESKVIKIRGFEEVVDVRIENSDVVIIDTKKKSSNYKKLLNRVKFLKKEKILYIFIRGCGSGSTIDVF